MRKYIYTKKIWHYQISKLKIGLQKQKQKWLAVVLFGSFIGVLSLGIGMIMVKKLLNDRKTATAK